ncbi:spore germination protein KB [Paenibacillus taihuensis]|uniref:Spore germination protein KB n=1 Tax=Paenibacillus taihuensis TaxID=1156355 RepID=A0A3D9S480_9BACL|nr:endospore germination permease [Paenibacillus taihuensis]REE87472.1 spore germination protein KB [Paenibacillus taihuensis]
MRPVKTQLSANQIFWIMTTMAVGVALLLTIGQSIGIANKNAWISVIICGFICAYAVFAASKLSQLYPKQSFIEYSQVILGKWLGRLVVLIYFVQWYSVTGVIMRELTNRMNLIMPRTPSWVIILGILAVVVYAVSQGIEVIGRCAEIIGPVIIFIVILTLLLSLNNWRTEFILPVFKDIPPIPILEGALAPAAIIGQNVILIMLFKFTPNPDSARKAAVAGTATASLLVTITVVFVITTFGPFMPAKMWYPYFELVRVISVVDFIQNVDVVFVVAWLASVFIRISVIFFAASYGMGQFLKLKNWKHVLWVNVPIVFILALLPRNIMESDYFYPKYFTEMFTLPILILGIPTLLWLLGVMRRNRR